MDKLTIEEVDLLAIKLDQDRDDFAGYNWWKLQNCVLQLADVMRENERLRAVLTYYAVGEFKTLEEAIEEYDNYLVLLNKDSGHSEEVLDMVNPTQNPLLKAE